ncbi:MAG: 50S ribosomal protein L34e [Candidatus Aenigmarchaeota archaeon]|nr:50S ribosomal protein L34e [Candidatus Aenigmarchaeota archaeon]
MRAKMRVKRRTPSGKILFHQRRERPSHAKCANCKSQLHGISRKIPSEFKKLSASEKGPERPYGGYLCSSCTRELFREKARGV